MIFDIVFIIAMVTGVAGFVLAFRSARASMGSQKEIWALDDLERKDVQNQIADIHRRLDHIEQYLRDLNTYDVPKNPLP